MGEEVKKLNQIENTLIVRRDLIHNHPALRIDVPLTEEELNQILLALQYYKESLGGQTNE